jgi:predicted dehydrogenase
VSVIKTVRFGIIGCGLMGKEFAGAAGRWCHLNEECPVPEIVAVCDTEPATFSWFTSRVPTIRYTYTDYKELLKNPEIDAVYCAVPHVYHKEIYVDIIESNKHFMGEKPFGMDKEANDAILEAIQRHPGSVIRCASEFPFYPACQKLIRWVKEGRTGRIIEVSAGLNHSSDMNPEKPINWKRMVSMNGEYGCMGDLGIHTEHIPFYMGWIPRSVCAKLYKYITRRPDGKGGTAPCDTWDNAVLICDTSNPEGNLFPMTLEMKRMKPGATNDWYIEVHGMKCSVRFSTNDANSFYFTEQMGSEQAWCRMVVGNKPQFPTATGAIFEFGFADAILQMWAAFLKEIDGQQIEFGCLRPEMTAISHKLHTAALRSKKENTVIEL